MAYDATNARPASHQPTLADDAVAKFWRVTRELDALEEAAEQEPSTDELNAYHWPKGGEA